MPVARAKNLVRPSSASPQRPDARPVVRADRARLHAHRRADGADQPRARILVRARGLCRHAAYGAASAIADGTCESVARAAARLALCRHVDHRARDRESGRHADRALHAAHLRQGSAVRAPLDLRRRDGDRGDDPPGLGHARLRAAGAVCINGGFLFGDLIWSTYRFYAAGIAAGVIGLVWLLIEKTSFGATVKAGAHDSEIVRALGINLSRLRLVVFVFGTMLAAIAGIIVAPIWGIRPHMGVDAVIPAFLVIVLGGVGSFWGAVVAGLLVGLCVGLAGAYASEWSLLSMYILLVAVVTFRARGLWGKKSVLEA